MLPTEGNLDHPQYCLICQSSEVGKQWGDPDIPGLCRVVSWSLIWEQLSSLQDFSHQSPAKRGGEKAQRSGPLKSQFPSTLSSLWQLMPSTPAPG